MLPLLFSIGPINFYTFALFLAIGFFLSSFLIWRRLRDLGIDEEEIIDLILLASLSGLIFSRIFFVIQNISLLGFEPGNWLLINKYPGLSFWGGAGGILLTVFWFSRKESLNFWQVLDEFVYGLMPFFILVQVGAFFDGSGFGKPTTMPWGIYIVGSLVKRQPLPLVVAVAFSVLWLFLMRIERHWRTWEWYKSKAYGLVALLFIFMMMLVNFLVAFWREGLLYWQWLEIGLSLILTILTAVIIYIRSGRRTFGETKEKKN
ncbi:MAG TPA: prolipoprotein diacylglyceryl transferase family protein [Patescibacteria group bacterium]|nr:prolipoprotein diacylglyceryl transferase family protein [Patescibacteria group bacterium]